MRVVLLLAIVVAAGVGIWLTLGQDDAPRASARLDEEGVDGAPLAVHQPLLVTQVGPPRRGEGEEPTGPPWSIEVEVVDEKGEPAAGVPVRLRLTGYSSWSSLADLQRVRTWQANALRRSFSNLAQEPEYVPIDEGTTDARGVLTLLGRGGGAFEVEAEPGDGRLCSYSTFYVAETIKAPARVVLRLLVAHEVVGRVVDEMGRGVAASLAPQVLDLAAYTFWRGRRAASSADGSFSFLAPAGPMHVTTAVVRRGSIRHGPFHLPSKTPLELVVPTAEGALRVIVESEAGARVVGAVVAAGVAEAPNATWYAETGADGVGVVHASAGLLRSLRVERPPWLALDQRHPVASWRGLRIPTSGHVEVRLVLQQGGSIHGIVRDGEGGPGLAGVTVHPLIVNRGVGFSPAAPDRATTDEGGRYRLEGLPLGLYVLLAEHPQRIHADLEGARGSPGPPPSMLAALLAAGSELERDLVMSQGVQVSGRVVDGSGAPVPGAAVVAPHGDSPTQALWPWQVAPPYDGRPLVEADEQGRFTVGLPPGRSIRLGARKDGLVGKYSTPISTAVGSLPAEVVLVVEQGVALRGRVLRALDRKPVAGASINVTAQPHDHWASAHLHALADADGRFEFGAVPAGELVVYCHSPGAGSRNLALQALEGGAAHEDLEFVIESGSDVVLRLVGKDDGLPIAGVAVLLMQGWNHLAQASSDREGLLRFEGIAAGSISVHVPQNDGSHGPPLHQFVAPAAGVVEVRYAAPPEHVLEGRVLGPDGAPVPLCSVRLTPVAAVMPGGMGGSAMSVQTVIGGQVTLAAVGQPPFMLHVSSPRDASGAPLAYRGREVKVSAEELAAGQVEVRLEQGAEIRVRVVGDAGEPIAHAQISLSDRSESRATGADGRAVFSAASPAEARVHVWSQGWRVDAAGYPVVPGGEETTITLVKGASIRGRVIRGTAVEVAQSTVMGRWEGGTMPAGSSVAQIDAEGAFDLAGLPDGVDVVVTLQIHTTGAGSVWMAPPSQIVAAGRSDVVFNLESALSIEGRVTTATGSGAGNVNVAVSALAGSDDKTARSANIRTAPDGRFVVRGLARGRWSLRASRSRGGQGAASTLEVEAGSRGVELVLPETTSIRGRAMGLPPAASPWMVAGVPSEAKQRPLHAKVESDGSFQLEDLAVGTRWDLLLTGQNATEYALATSVESGKQDVDLQLIVGQAIGGRVHGVDPSAQNKTWVQCEHERGYLFYAKLDDQGRFVRRGLPPGTYTLSCMGSTTSPPRSGVVAGTMDVVLQANP